MARIRTIKPDFWTDEKVVELSFEARLFFIGSWNFADDYGNLQRSAKKLKMQIFPADVIDCEPLIQSLMAHGMLIEYEVSGEKYLHIKGFKAHQVINRPSKSGLPAPNSLPDAGALTESSLTEGKGRERKGKDKNPLNPPGTEEPGSGKPTRVRLPRCTLNTFLTDCKAKGEKPISDYAPLQHYVETVGLPIDLVNLAWKEFKRQFTGDGKNATKLQARWRQHFQNYVEGNYLKLWYAQPDGTFALSTPGLQAQAFHDSHREAA